MAITCCSHIVATMKTERARIICPCKQRPVAFIKESHLPLQEGLRLLLFVVLSSLLKEVNTSDMKWKPSATPFELLALSLFALPDVLTIQKLLELLTFAERSQTLQAEQMLYSLKPKHNYEEVLPAFSLRKRALSVFLTP